MSEVFAAYDATLRRGVAVKVLAEGFSGDRIMRQRFLREATLAASLESHPHVVTVHDAGLWEGRPYFVMELAAGSVADRLRAGVPDRRWALVWLAQAADALDAAHGRGIVHRDVKPSNMLVDEYGAIRVTDFGIAHNGEGTLTGSGEILGTAGYLAPEQARGERCTAASDRYSFAVVARELLTGSRDGELDPSAAVVFDRALAQDPARRYPDASTFVEDVRRALEEPQPTQRTVLMPVQGPRPTRPRRRTVKRVAVVLGVAMLACGSALATYALAVDPEHDPATPSAVRPTTCTASPIDHDANVVVRGVRAGAYCNRIVRTLAAGGETWSYRNGRRLVAPDHGVTEVSLVCQLRNRRLRLQVYDSGSQSIGTDFCYRWSGGSFA